MPNNIDNAIRAAIRSMNEVIVPALDPANPLAGEQSALLLQLLDFLRVRIPYVQQRDRAEVAIYHDIAAQLMHELAILLPDQLDKVRDILAEAETAIANPVPAPDDLPRLADDLRTVLSDLVRAAAEAPEPLRQKVESAVARIVESPMRYPEGEHGTREHVLPSRFPYTIVYRVVDGLVVVVAVAHQSREPGYWRQRR